MTYLEDAASSAATAANEVQASRAVENAQRAELERLQHRLDESLDANKTLRSQLSESSASLTRCNNCANFRAPPQGRRT